MISVSRKITSLAGLVGCAGLTLILGCPIRPASIPVHYDNDSYRVKDESLDEILRKSFKVDSAQSFRVNDSHNVLGRSSGSCTGLYRQGGYTYFLTCAHVVYVERPPNIPSYVKVKRTGGIQSILLGTMKIPVQIEKVSVDDDLALLKAKGDYPVIGLDRLAKARFVKPGDFVYVVGHPLGLEKPYLSQGIIGQKRDNSYLVTANITFGNSGGGAYVLKDGKPWLVGVAAFTYRGRGIGGIWHVNDVRRFLK